MKSRLCFLLVAALVCGSSFAQEDNPNKASKASYLYHQHRSDLSVPTYGLAKVKRLIKSIKGDPDENHVLPARKFNALNSREKFTYIMIHGEEFSQNCDYMPAEQGEEKRIPAFAPDAFDDSTVWSDHERQYMANHRGEMITLMRSTIRTQKMVGSNFKQAILELNAWELIPDLVATFNLHKKDNDIVTVLIGLMKNGKYKPLMESATYKKLYGDPDASYKSFIDGNPDNQKLECDRAMAYYRSMKK